MQCNPWYIYITYSLACASLLLSNLFLRQHSEIKESFVFSFRFFSFFLNLHLQFSILLISIWMVQNYLIVPSNYVFIVLLFCMFPAPRLRKRTGKEDWERGLLEFMNIITTRLDILVLIVKSHKFETLPSIAYQSHYTRA